VDSSCELFIMAALEAMFYSYAPGSLIGHPPMCAWRAIPSYRVVLAPALVRATRARGWKRAR